MAQKVIFFTGAGISAESGIQTFRDANGLWEGHKITEVCDIGTWKKNKKAVFEFYNQRRTQLANVQPNHIHTSIAKLQKEFGIENVIVITQNIDDLLEKAGVKEVIHLHGNLKEMECKECGHIWDVGYTVTDPVSTCSECDSPNCKPRVVFFGESAPEYYTMKQIFRDVRPCDIVVVMGTLGNVVPIERHMQTTYGFKILNNLEKSPYIPERSFDKCFYKKGTEAIDEIYEIIKEKLKK